MNSVLLLWKRSHSLIDNLFPTLYSHAENANTIHLEGLKPAPTPSSAPRLTREAMATIAAAQSQFHRRLALLNDPAVHAALASHASLMTTTSRPHNGTNSWESLLGLTADEAHARKREWNRGPLTDLFPRIPNSALERILDICIKKDFTYDLSQAKLWNARRFTAITVAHVRHQYSTYDQLLNEGVERFEARRQSGPTVWKMLKEWCPWDSSNEALEKCFKATLVPFEQREVEYAFVDDPMDIDTESDFGGKPRRNAANGLNHAPPVDFADDPMEID